MQSLDGDTDIRHFTMQRDTSLDRSAILIFKFFPFLSQFYNNNNKHMLKVLPMGPRNAYWLPANIVLYIIQGFITVLLLQKFYKTSSSKSVYI